MKSVESTLHIMELIAEHQPISLAQLCERINRPTASIQRGVNTLREFGWIKPESATGQPRWIVSNRFLSLAPADNPVSQLARIARPYLIDIRDSFNETCFVSTFDLSHVTVIDFADSTHAVRLVGGTGGNIPACIASTGRACLALLPQDAVDKVIKGVLKQQPQLNMHRFKADLPAIRKQGYALVEGEWADELTQLGCAIVDKHQYPIGGIGVSIPRYRVGELDQQALIQALQSAAREISLALAGAH